MVDGVEYKYVRRIQLDSTCPFFLSRPPPSQPPTADRQPDPNRTGPALCSLLSSLDLDLDLQKARENAYGKVDK